MFEKDHLLQVLTENANVNDSGENRNQLELFN